MTGLVLALALQVAGDQIPVSATATDPSGVRGVVFHVDGQAIGPEDTTEPYSAVWDTSGEEAGNYRVGATACDTLNNCGELTAVQVELLPPPDTSPPTGEVQIGAAVARQEYEIEVVPDGRFPLNSIQVLINGQPLGVTSTSPPYTIGWNTSGLANAEYLITARTLYESGYLDIAGVRFEVRND